MQQVFLNDRFLPAAEARISPMDRGFLFGDGIYEVIPSYSGKMVGFAYHIERLQQGLDAIGIPLQWKPEHWFDIFQTLLSEHTTTNVGIYLQVTRGTDDNRYHAFPKGILPTVFAYTFPISDPPIADIEKVKTYRVNTEQDRRWRRCNIKSVSLLGNVLHFQSGYAQGLNETLLYNEQQELTEASACNAFIVTNGRVITPPLDHQLLPGVTRRIVLEALNHFGEISVEERPIPMAEALAADEVWITSSSKEIAPVVAIDGKPVGTGKPGPVWLAAQQQYTQYKFDV